MVTMARSSKQSSSSLGGADERTSSRVGRIVKWVLGLLVIALLALYPGRWVLDSTNEKQGETAVVEAEIDELELEAQRYVDLERLRGDFEDQFAIAQAAVPQSPDLPGILDQVVDLERRTGTKLLRFLPEPPEAVTSPGADPSLQNEMSLTIAVSGKEADVVSFVRGLRELSRTIVVDGVKLTWPQNLLDLGDLQEIVEDGGEAASADLGGETDDAGDPLSVSLEAAELDPELELVAFIEARAFVWVPGALPDSLMAQIIAAGNAPSVGPDDADGGDTGDSGDGG